MYRSFYGLKNEPFTLKPDGDCVYLSDIHQEAIANLLYGVNAEKGFLMLTGEVGTGKTTLLNALLSKLDDSVHVCLINNPKLEAKDFYQYAASLLGFQFGTTKGEFIIEFLDLLDHCTRQNEKILIIIDEAQFFSVDLMDEVRLLANHAGDRNVLSIFLVGQRELNDVLAHERLRPLRHRIELRYHLSELTRKDTAQYIAFRLGHAGASDTAIFTDEAIDSIHHATRGNPRLINVVCDRALIAGYIGGMHNIGREIIAECLREIRMPGESALQLSGLDSFSDQGSKRTIISKTKKTEHLFRNTAFTLLIFALIGSAVYFSFQRGWWPLEKQRTTINIRTLQMR